jgi:hypothetical protein
MPSPPIEKAEKKKKTAAVMAKKIEGPPLWMKVVIPAGILGVIALVAYSLGAFTPVFRLAGLLGSEKDLSAVQTTAPVGDIDRPDTSEKTEEATPVDPSKARLPLLDKPTLLEGQVAREPAPPAPESSLHGRQRASPPEAGATPGAPLSGEQPPSIVTRQPAASPTPEDDLSRRLSKEPDKGDSPDKGKEAQIAAAPRESLDTTQKEQKESEATTTPRTTQPGIASRKPPAEPEDQGRSEQFQLPGSLIVNIPKYTGVTPKWALMVILDDSAIMGRKNKSWNPSRLQTAINLAGKLPTAIAPGSKIAVRDFVCTKSEDKKKARVNCLSNIRYDWAESPFKGLTEKVGQSTPGGINNPCAAAAFSLKKDFAAISGLTPRILVLTDGTPKCNHSDLFSALDEHGKDRVSVDVVAIGMKKKRLNAYSAVTKKTNGFFVKIDKPSDVENAVKSYEKTLKAKLMEKIEIRGEKATITTIPGKEVTLVPGTYSVMLPAVAGIHASKRRIENVKISSGQARTITIEPEKGRPVIGKKEPRARKDQFRASHRDKSRKKTGENR